MRYGVDFTIPFQVMLGRGAFGSVSQCCYINKEKRRCSVAIKRICLKREQNVCVTTHNLCDVFFPL